MNNHKKIILSLTLLTLPMIHGCNDEEMIKKPSSTVDSEAYLAQEIKIKKEISKIESEIYTELKSTNGSSYRSMLGEATSDEEIIDYDNVNLLSVKILSDPYEYKIKLFYDESLLKVSVFENFLDPVYSTAYNIARKNKIIKSEVEIYVNDRLLEY